MGAPLGERADLADQQGREYRRRRPQLAVKLPPDSASFVSAKIRGLSERRFASGPERCRGLPQQVEHAAMTCGWQRRQYGSCTRSSIGEMPTRGSPLPVIARNRRPRSGRDGRADVHARIERRVGAPSPRRSRARPGDPALLWNTLDGDARQCFRGRELRAV